MSERSYINSEGFVVFTSKHLRAKNSCCKSNCLHCPYGTTLKNIGVEIKDSKTFETSVVEEYKEMLFPTNNFTSSLLAEAFGSSPNLRNEDLKVLTLKDVICGMAYIDNKKLIKFALLPHFSDQGIDEGYLRSILE